MIKSKGKLTLQLQGPPAEMDQMINQLKNDPNMKALGVTLGKVTKVKPPSKRKRK